MSDPEHTSPAPCDLTEDQRSDIIARFGERGRKALRILDAGHVVRYRDFFVVQGSLGEYVVEGDLCTCGDFLFRKRECAHILAVKIAGKTGRYRTIDRWYQDTLRGAGNFPQIRKSGSPAEEPAGSAKDGKAESGERTNPN